MNEELKIDPEFEKVIPPLTDDEYEQLEENIVSEGIVLMPLIIWDGIIVDGHNRYKIIQAHPDVEYRTHEKQFDDRFEAIAWICKNQLGRRNLSNTQKITLMGERYKAEKMTHGASRGNQYTKLATHQNDALPKDSHIVAARLASEMGVSRPTIERAEMFVDGMNAADKISNGIKRDIISGSIKPNQSDVIAIGKALPEERTKLVENLLKPKDKSPSKPKPPRAPTEDEKQLEQISEISEDMVRPHPCITEKDILGSMEGAIQMMIDTCNNYFMRYPKLRTEPEYKIKVKEIMQELQKYIDEIEGEESI